MQQLGKPSNIDLEEISSRSIFFLKLSWKLLSVISVRIKFLCLILGLGGAELKLAMEQNPLIKGRLDITNISIPIIQPDDNTQNNLNLIVAEFAKGSVLDQQKLNADKAKVISETNAQVDQVTRCLEIAKETGKEPGFCLHSPQGIVVGASK